MLKVSVIICSYNREAYIINALESMYRQTLDKSLFEVYVVDNNSTDNTKNVCKEYLSKHTDANFYYVTETSQGASFARNTGAALAKSGVLVFMDDDAVAYPDYLERVVHFFDNNKNASALGGRIIPKYIPAEPKWMSHFVSSLVGNFDYSKTAVEFAPGKYPLESNMAVRKEDFNLVGGFNTKLPGVKGTLRIGGEGKDFFLKLQNAGKKFYYDPAIIVDHVVEVKKLTREYMYRVASGIGRGERVRTKEIGAFEFFKKSVEYIFKLGASFVLALIYIFQGHPAKAAPVINFRIDALKGLWGK